MNEFRFFNPYAAIRQTANRLPHWQQNGATYFVTFRLADSVPANLLTKWEAQRRIWLSLHPEPWTEDVESQYHRRFSGAIERFLDNGHGQCLLRRPDCGQIVADALRYFDGTRVLMISFVVMPNHVHALFVQNPVWLLEKLLRSWKRFAGKGINALVDRSGTLWQKDYFDRLIRDEKHFANCVRYIRHNPRRARLPEGTYILYESEVALRY